MIFLAEERRADGVYGHDIDAESAAEAERICASLGWELKGTLEAVIPFDSDEPTWDREVTEASVAALLSRVATPPAPEGE